jgi:transketolase
MALGFADVVTVLCLEFLLFDGADPARSDRDRIVLSAGHGSALLYAVLHLMGVPAFDTPALRRFRHQGGPASAHPEFNPAIGIDATTGPLGQGVANAVGLAIEAKRAAALHGGRECHVYALAGDGCLMEGISHEAGSLAGHLALDNLTLLYDANATTCDGDLAMVQSEDVVARFAAYGWSASAIDGHDVAAIRAALAADRSGRPRLIACRTLIGKGAPNKQGSVACHGVPLGAAETAALREALNRHESPFDVAEEVRAIWQARNARAAQASPAPPHSPRSPDAAHWQELRRALDAMAQRQPGGCSTRDLNGVALAALRAPLGLVGGAADLDESTRVTADPADVFTRDNRTGSHIRFGIREAAMAAILNGVASFGSGRGFCATYLVFSDYMRPAIRLAAMMRVPNLYLFTHDSIFASEDGATHQPVEQIPSLACMPGLVCARPADADELLAVWRAIAANTDMPTALFLSRQDIPPVGRASPEAIEAEGLCVRYGAETEPEVTIATWGSEVAIAMAAAMLLVNQGIATRVVSVPLPHIAARLPAPRRTALFGRRALPVTIFAHGDLDWSPLLGRAPALRIHVDRYGAGGSAREAACHAGLEPDRIAALIAAQLRGSR